MTDCVTEYGINPASFKFITKKSYEENKTKTANEADIIINRAGNPGITIIVTNDMKGIMACGFSFILRLKDKYDPYYVASFLNSKWGRMQTERYSFGSILDHITKDDPENVIIAFPKDKKQSKSISDEYKESAEHQMKARELFKKIQNAFNNNGFLKL